jgi:hypothetical protein
MRLTRKNCHGSPIGAITLTGTVYRRMLSLRHHLGARGDFMGKTHHGTATVLQFRRARAHALHHSNGTNRLDELDRVGDSLDRPSARIGYCPARNSSQRVVVDSRAGGDDLPRSVPLVRLQRGDDLIELHDLILGVCALTVKACAPRHLPDDHGMPKTQPADETSGSVFRENLRRLIGDVSVNQWSKRHALEQTTIQRLLTGAEPKLSMIEKIAEAVGLEPWQLLVPLLQPNNPPIAIGAHGPEEVDLWKRIEALRLSAVKPAEAQLEEPTRRAVSK